ncbi:cysteine peptidase family C39 domain-containing protein [Undibacterium sp. SXout11W]
MKLTIILQTESSECGLACLAMIASHDGHHVDRADFGVGFLLV